MKLKVIGETKDLRTKTRVMYLQVPISDYLQLVGNDFADFEIQRNRQRHKAYARMRNDIRNGTLLPTITLALKKGLPIPTIEGGEIDIESGTVHILDGLQRTFILKDIEKEGHKYDEEHQVLLELWFEESVRNLIYRLIVLNAGQKPMSLRHQIELLFMTITDDLINSFPGIEIYHQKDETRRRSHGKYALDRIATSYQCFLLKTYEVQRDNIVAQNLREESILNSDDGELHEQFNLFKVFFKHYIELDELITLKYSGPIAELASGAQNGLSWVASEPFMHAFFGVAGDFSSGEKRRDRLELALKVWKEQLRSDVSDPLDLNEYWGLLSAPGKRRLSVGQTTKMLLSNGFKEFIREEGEKSWKQCWLDGMPD